MWGILAILGILAAKAVNDNRRVGTYSENLSNTALSETKLPLLRTLPMLSNEMPADVDESGLNGFGHYGYRQLSGKAHQVYKRQ